MHWCGRDVHASTATASFVIEPTANVQFHDAVIYPT